MCSFILAMALHPQIQKTAQKALDVSLGGRLPDFSDYGNTPYIEALINEVLRWNPVAPVGIFHATSQDDAYRRYVIPKGSVVVPNIWAVLHDPEVYGAHPERFRPERFLTPEGAMNPKVPDTDAAFGYGRRICPGRGASFICISNSVLRRRTSEVMIYYRSHGAQHTVDHNCLHSGCVRHHRSRGCCGEASYRGRQPGVHHVIVKASEYSHSNRLLINLP